MSIEDIVESKGITEVLHFTTNEGLLGVLHSQAVKSRESLPEDKQLEYIFSPNAIYRKDTAWLRYVNLSISRINQQFFEVCSQSWHIARDIWWCILSFDPTILSHEGVYFATTNNFYPSVRREKGIEGLEALFAPSVQGVYGTIISRELDQPSNYTTCPQAEVLYPEEVSTQHLKKIYVINGTSHDDISAQLKCVEHPAVEIIIKPDLFRGGAV